MLPQHQKKDFFFSFFSFNVTIACKSTLNETCFHLMALFHYFLAAPDDIREATALEKV